MTILEQAQYNLLTAHQILEELNLLKLWRDVGEPIIVGAVAYNLIINPDIDLEIYCSQPEAIAGFSILLNCVKHQNVIEAKYANHLNDEDKGIYFQIKYKNYDNTIWKIDMWLMEHDHPGPCARDLIVPLIDALTDEIRESILTIKEQIRLKPIANVTSIRVYEAVIDDNVKTFDEFVLWFQKHQPIGLTRWLPKDKWC